MYTIRLFSKKRDKLSLADLDHLEGIEGERKANKWLYPTGFGIMGASLGSMASRNHKGRAGLAGAIAGGVGGHYLNKKVADPSLVREEEKYKKGTKEDRAYFRRKREKEADRNAMIEAAYWGGMLAGR